MIELRAVSKSYRIGEAAVPVLRGISLDVQAGEFVAIMGPSGSGKSTLLNIIGCLDTLDEGSYRFGSHDVGTLEDDDLTRLRSQQIGFVFQLFNLIPRIDALRNVALPMVYRRIPAHERTTRARNALERVGLSLRASHSPAQLSGGQQQRVAIARALVNDPALLIADEPTGSLDSTATREIMRLFQALHDGGKTIVMVTHEEEVARYAQRVVHLLDGVVDHEVRK